MILSIREETERDFGSVHEIHQKAFRQNNEARLVDALRHSASFIPELSLVAVIKEEIVGHILFTKIHIIGEQKVHDSLALAPVAVLPGYQQQGIGSQLIQKGLQRAKACGYDSVVVLGHEQYYPKFGFAPAHTWNIKAPFDVPPNAFMAIELKPGILKQASGTVQYPQEFDEV